MCDQGGFDALVSRALRGRDALLFKLVRNFSQHEALKPRFHRRALLRLSVVVCYSTCLISNSRLSAEVKLFR